MRKLNYRNLETLPEWQFLSSKLIRMSKDYGEDLINAARRGEVSQVQFLAGLIDMINMTLAMPKEDMPGETNASESDEETD